MKNQFNANKRIAHCLFVLVLILLNSCGKWSVPAEVVGQWKSNKVKITVRTEPDRGRFEFTSDSASIIIRINSDNTVSGSVGDAVFENGIIKKNWGNPERTGLAFIIKCGSIGKIFENDPIENKEVQLWLSPLKKNIDAELRYTQGGSQFPMAGVVFTKVDE